MALLSSGGGAGRELRQRLHHFFNSKILRDPAEGRFVSALRARTGGATINTTMATRKRSKRAKKKVRRIVPAADGVRVIVHCVNECGTKYTTAKRGDNKVEWTKTLRRLNAHECKRCRGSPASSLSQPAAHAGRQKLFGRPALRHLPLFGSGDSSEESCTKSLLQVVTGNSIDTAVHSHDAEGIWADENSFLSGCQMLF